MAELVVLVINYPEKTDEVLAAWVAAGVSGATILNSTGLAHRMGSYGARDDLPLILSLSSLLRSQEKAHRTLFALVPDGFNIDALIAATEAEIGRLEDPIRAFSWSFPSAVSSAGLLTTTTVRHSSPPTCRWQQIQPPRQTGREKSSGRHPTYPETFIMLELTMFRRLIVGYCLIIMLWLAGCTAAPESIPTPVTRSTPAAATIGLVVASGTPTTLPLSLPLVTIALITATPAATETAVPTPSSSPSPVLAVTGEAPLRWSEKVSLVQQIPSSQVVWSPQANQFAYDNCTQLTIEAEMGAVFVAEATTPARVVGEFTCSTFGSNQRWTPDGQQLLFTGLRAEDLGNSGHIPEVGNIFMTNLSDGTPRLLLRHWQVSTKWDPSLLFWLDDQTFLYTGYGGGGHSSTALVNFQAGTRSQLAVLHVGGIGGFNARYLVGQAGLSPTTSISALVIPLEEMWAVAFNLSDTTIPQEDYFLSRPRPLYLSANDAETSNEFDAFTFNSTMMDWLPQANEMLVRTWDKGLDLIENAPVTTHLQSWRVDTNVLTLLVPDAVYGRFSPDGHYLVYLTLTNNTAHVHLLDRITGEIVLTQPEAVTRYIDGATPSFVFSPDSRYFIAFKPEPTIPDISRLTLFDLTTQQTVATFPARFTQPVWSPDSLRFLYKNELNALTLYTVADGSPLSLTQNNDSRLANPNWSFDGTYLSVTVKWGEVDETIILSIP